MVAACRSIGDRLMSAFLSPSSADSLADCGAVHAGPVSFTVSILRRIPATPNSHGLESAVLLLGLLQERQGEPQESPVLQAVMTV